MSPQPGFKNLSSNPEILSLPQKYWTFRKGLFWDTLYIMILLNVKSQIFPLYVDG